MNSTANKSRVFGMVTKRIIEHLQNGVVPWKKSWADKGLPINLLSGKPYRGINLWLLNYLDYPENIFLTENQAKELGGWVREGEKPHLVTHWQLREAGGQGHLSKTPTLKPYNVFNIAQCANISDDLVPVKNRYLKSNQVQKCKEVIEQMPDAPQIIHRGIDAKYQPVLDFVSIPSASYFINDECYYATLFKVLIFATGSQNRLNRKAYQAMKPNDFKEQSLEELIAEIGASYLCSYCGIDTWNFQNRMEYIEKWIERFQNDTGFIVYAATQAQKAVDYILGEQHVAAEEWKINEEHLQFEAYE